jgi:uncharacterized membrane protein
MHEQRHTSHDLKADLAKLAQDDTPELKAGLAKLVLDAAPDGPHAAARVRNYFLTGLVIIGPVAITIYIAWHFINIVDARVKPYIPAIFNPDSYLPFPIPGVGLIIAIVGLILIGGLAANLLGRSFISAGEMMLARLPIVRNVYRGLKQIFESVVTATNPKENMQRVALVQFPSNGIWSIAFVTGNAADEIRAQASGEDLISVFIAHGLLPPSGFTCFVPRKDVVPLKMSIEDAAKIILSAGMASPEGRTPQPPGIKTESDMPPGSSRPVASPR